MNNDCLGPLKITHQCCGSCAHWNGPQKVREGYQYGCAEAEKILQGIVPMSLEELFMEYCDGRNCPTYVQVSLENVRFSCRWPGNE